MYSLFAQKSSNQLSTFSNLLKHHHLILLYLIKILYSSKNHQINYQYSQTSSNFFKHHHLTLWILYLLTLSLIRHRNVIFRNREKRWTPVTFGKAIDETFSSRFINQTVETAWPTNGAKSTASSLSIARPCVNRADDRGEIGVRRRRSSIDPVAPSTPPSRRSHSRLQTARRNRVVSVRPREISIITVRGHFRWQFRVMQTAERERAVSHKDGMDA